MTKVDIVEGGNMSIITNIRSYSLLMLIFLGGVVLYSGCSTDSTTTSTTDEKTYLSLPFPPDSSFIGVTRLLVKVTAPDLASPITATHEIDHNQSYALINLTVSAGANRRFTVYGVNAENDSLFWASVTVAIAGSRRNDVAAMLIPINQRTRVFIPYPRESLFDMVDEIKVTVSGADIVSPIISTQAVDHDQTSITLNLAVPSGDHRNFDILASNPSGQYLYRAQTDISVSDSQNTNFALSLSQVGFGQATRVRIFRNNLPQGYGDLDSLLVSLDFTQGAGDNQYQVFNSTLMGSILLVPGRDLVVFQGLQDSFFYKDYMSAKDYFESFIDSGGAALMEVNESTHANYYEIAGMQFPGGIEYVTGLSGYNRLVLSEHSITGGLADSLTGNQASYGGFTTLPPGALVLTQDVSSRPSLVCFTLGKGQVMMSTQPLEYLYNHRNTYTAGSLLSRIIRFMLGKDPTPNPLVG
jgi:hypothetical protein